MNDKCTITAIAPIKEAEFVSVWDGGFAVATSCKVNMATKEVFDGHLPSKISRLIADESAYIVGSREDYPGDLAQLAHNRLNAVPYGTAHNTNSEGNDGNL